MTTIPPEHSGSGPATHEYRQVAESFGTDAERYDRARPSYPDALVQRIIAASPGREVLDVGCGTGIAARLFQAAGCEVLGVDPDARMAGLARQRGLPVEVAKFEDWDNGSRRFDMVVAAQAWHWIDPVAGAARAARALRPGGRLAVFWNAFQPPADIGEAFAEVYRRVPTGLPINPSAARRPAIESYRAMCATAADGMRRAGGFSDAEQWQLDWERPYTRDEWLEFVPTAGGMSQIPPDRLAELLAGIGAAIDAAGGSFIMQYSTVAETAARA
jgi:SAM-dependent methyltransferase